MKLFKKDFYEARRASFRNMDRLFHFRMDKFEELIKISFPVEGEYSPGWSELEWRYFDANNLNP